MHLGSKRREWRHAQDCAPCAERLESRQMLNAAPVLDDQASPAFADVIAGVDAPAGAVGTLVSSLIDANGPLKNFSDPDGDEPGLAITGVNLEGGTLWYSRDDGISWRSAEGVSVVTPVLLPADATSRLAYQPASGFSGVITDLITFQAWDRRQAWEQLGGEVEGLAAADRSGVVALSSDGLTLALGGPGSAAAAGSVQVLRREASGWELLGDRAVGGSADDFLGNAVALSADGSVVAMGAVGHNNSQGQIRVLEWDSQASTWRQRGDLIDGSAAGDFLGESVSLSADGATLAIGAWGATVGGDRPGQTDVYSWNGTAWTRRGNPVVGKTDAEVFGWSTSLSADGNTLAVGAWGGVDAQDTQTGRVAIYAWQTDAWVQLGGDIVGTAAGDWTGWSVALAGDGRSIAVGSSGSGANGDFSGQADVYAWDGSAWAKRGDSIAGAAAGDEAGAAISLSSDGMVLAVGSRLNGDAAALSGHVRTFAWSGSNWEKLAPDIQGEGAGDEFGATVSLSGSGRTLAAGSLLHDGASGVNSGHARVFALEPFLSVASDTASIVVLVNDPPASVNLSGAVESLPANTKTDSPIEIASISIEDDGVGINTLSLSGVDADKFEIVDNTLFLKSGTKLKYKKDAALLVTVEVQDLSLAGSTPATASLTIAVTRPEKVVDVAEGETATDDADHTGDEVIVKRGKGKLILNKANTHTGGVRVEAGELIVQRADSLNSGPLTAKGTSAVRFEVGMAIVNVAELTLEGDALLDVGEGGVHIPADTADAAALRQSLISGRNNGTWDGARGIVMSTSGANRGIGYRVNADDSLTARVTANGDAQLDGAVNFDDILALFPNYGNASANFVWAEGDFTYDGKVDFDDILALFPNYGSASIFGGGGGLSGGGGAAAASAPTGADTTAPPADADKPTGRQPPPSTIQGPQLPTGVSPPVGRVLTRPTTPPMSLAPTLLAFASLAATGPRRTPTNGGLPLTPPPAP